MNLATIAGIIVAAGTASTAEPETDARPVILEAARQGDGLRVLVIGHSACAVTAHYRLEAESGSSRGSNRSVQSGTATLRPGERKTLISLSLGSVSEQAWKVRLIVTIEGGQGYVIEKTTSL